MNSRATLFSLRRVLRQEFRKHRGQIGDLDVRLGHRRGYLSRVLRTPSLTLRTLLAAMEWMAVDMAGFFAVVFERREEPEDLLKPAGRVMAPSPAWQRIEAATRELEERAAAAVPTGAPVRSRTAREQAAEVKIFCRCRLQEQRRRLRSARKYRHRGFVQLYLQHLDGLLDTQPHAVRQLTETLALDLVPSLDEGGDTLLALQSRILGLYASAEMILGAGDDATRALNRAMELARSREFTAGRAELLERGARLLWARRQPRRALHLLDRAQLLHFDLDQRCRLARVLADRGAVLGWLGDDQNAIRVLTQALGHLRVAGGDLRRYRALTLQRLARAHERLGDGGGQVNLMGCKATQSRRSNRLVRAARLVAREERSRYRDG